MFVGLCLEPAFHINQALEGWQAQNGVANIFIKAVHEISQILKHTHTHKFTNLRDLTQVR